MGTIVSNAKAYGNAVGSQWRVGVRYSVSSDDSPCTLITINVHDKYALGANQTFDSDLINRYIGTTQKWTVTLDGTDVPPYVNNSTTRLVNTTELTMDAPHGQKTINFVVSLYMSGGTATSGASITSGTSTVTIPITLPSLSSWQVTYNANGGSGAPSAQTKWYNETLLLSKTTPTRSNSTANRVVTFTSHGTTAWPVTNCPASLTSVATTKYTFSKWQKSGTSSYYYPNTVYSDNAALPLTAVWTSSTTATSITLPSPTRTGYNFNGWYTAASGGTRVGGAGASYTPAASITLHAQWTEKTYTIKFDGNGGTGVPANQTKYHTTALTIPSTPKPTRTNYVFKNWNTIKAGTGTSFNAGGNYTLNGNATLYAQYYAPYIISYGANGGSNAPANTVKPYNTAVNLTTSKPAYGGMEFLGWNTNTTSTGTHYDSGAEIAANANANLSLYAVWRGVSVDVIRPKRNGTTVSFTADWTLKGSVAGSGSIIAEYAKNTSSTWTSITLSGTKTLTKSAGNPTTGSVSGTFTLPVADSARIRLTATFNDSYGTTSSTSTHTITATRTTTVGKPFKLFSALHGGNGLAIGVIASLANTLEVAWKAVFGGTVTSKNSAVDPSSASGSDTYVNGFRFVDSNDTFLGAVQIGQDANNNLYASLFTSRNVNGTDIGNRILTRVGSDGTRSYYVTDAQAFREAINAVQCANAATMKAAVGSLSGATQWWSLYAWCINSANTGKNGHRLGLIVDDTTISGYDWDASGTKTQWSAYTTAKKPSASDVGALPISGGTMTGNILQSAVSRGYYLKDSAGNNYPGVYDNGSNLWIGSTQTAATHHKGQTYISAGYNGSAGNSTIYVSVPNSSNNGGTNYEVYHKGHKPSLADIGAQAAGNYVTFPSGANSSINTPGGATQLWSLYSTVLNSANTTNYNHRVGLFTYNDRLALYDSTDSEWLWTAYTTANKPTPAAIGAASTNTSGAINKDSYEGYGRCWYIDGISGGISGSAQLNDHIRLYVKTTGLNVYNATDSKGVVNVPGFLEVYSNSSGTTGSVSCSTAYIPANGDALSALLCLIVCFKGNDGFSDSCIMGVPGVITSMTGAALSLSESTGNGANNIKRRTIYLSSYSTTSFTLATKTTAETDISVNGTVSGSTTNHIYITNVICVYDASL